MLAIPRGHRLRLGGEDLGALSLAEHRTAALPHGLADIWLPKRDRGLAAGARRRRNGL
jgi:hypothetical protein